MHALYLLLIVTITFLSVPPPGFQSAGVMGSMPLPPAGRTFALPAAPSGLLRPSASLLPVAGLVAVTGHPRPGDAPAPNGLLLPTQAASAGVTGRQLHLVGRDQSLPLSCEARSAADWAGYFGVAIEELEFQARLPRSDDPELGFVGNADDARGQLPPASYGVHARPVAALLNEYGLRAQARRGLTWDVLRAEIDAGRPVIVWVVGHVWDNGIPVRYTAQSSGNTSNVARYEHTVIVTGYDAHDVIVLDGVRSYTRPLAQFLRSWSILGNLAVIAGD